MKIKPNTLHLGDCLDVMKSIRDKSIHFIFADLPYGQLASKWDKKIDLQELWKEYKRILHPDGTVALFGQQPFTTDLINSNRKFYKYSWYWEKNQSTNFFHAKRQPLRKVEDITIFYSKKYYPQKTEGNIPTNSAKGKSYGGAYHGDNKREYEGGETTRHSTNLLKFKCVNNYKKLHTSEKPVDLLEFIIRCYTLENQIVLDNVMGSGSTIEACIRLNRKYIGIEKDKKIFKIAEKRVRSYKYE